MAHKISLIRGDGIGPEIVDATVDVIEALGVDIEWEEVRAGGDAARDLGSPLPLETLESIDKNGVVLKGPLATPIGSGYRSINVALRTHFDLFANVRPARSIAGVETPFKNVDLVTVRENTEGAYAGIEHTIPPNGAAAESIMLITRYGSERVIRHAFEYAKKTGRKKVTIVHKANILKETSGLFLRVGKEIAEEYPEIECDDKIVDNMCMQMVQRPEQFDVIVTTNLFGDILSDLAAGLIGGLGLTAGSNVGAKHAMFEAVHGTAPDIAGEGIANPTALMFSACMMLEHIGEVESGKRMREAILSVLEDGTHATRDLGGMSNTKQYAEAIVAKLQ